MTPIRSPSARRLLDGLGAGAETPRRLGLHRWIALIPRDGQDAESAAARRRRRPAGGQAHRPRDMCRSTPGALVAREARRRPGGPRATDRRRRPDHGRAAHRHHRPAAPTPTRPWPVSRPAGTSNPLHWFALADEFGLRDELELACLAKPLKLLLSPPRGNPAERQPLGPAPADNRTAGDPRRWPDSSRG